MRTRTMFLGALCALVMLSGGATTAGADGGGSGSVSLGAGTTYVQNFNTLATTGIANTLLPTGWYLEESGTSARNDGGYAANNGSSNTGDTYSYGSTDSTERAFGTLLSGTLTPTIGAQFVNGTGSTIMSLEIAYTGEQWRLGMADRGPDRLDFQVSTNATSLITGTWTDVDALDFSSPVTTGAVGARDGNASPNRTPIAGSLSVDIPPDATFWIRWQDFNVSGADDGLAVDDFSITGQTDGPAEDQAPTVVATSPANGATGVAPDTNISITFSEPVDVTDPWFSITCSASGPHTATTAGGPTTFTLDPDDDFLAGESCRVTVFGDAVSDQDANDPPDTMAADHVFTFTTEALQATISEIQGLSHISPLVGRLVKDVEGIVTARRTAGGRGHWIQDPVGDGNDATSDGVFVFLNQAPAAQIGDAVRVRGTVTEFRGGCPDPCTPAAGSGFNNLTITQITSSNANVEILSTGNSLPAPTVIGFGGRMPPTETIDDDSETTRDIELENDYDPSGDAIDFYESLEGMLVRVDAGSIVVGPTKSFGEITVLPNGGSWASGLRSPRGGILLSGYEDGNPERIQVDDEILRDLAPAPRPAKAMPDMDVGAIVTTPIVGPLDYTFANYKIQATTTPTFVPSSIVRETAVPPRDQELAVATFNVENLAATDPQAKFDELASMIVANLRSPDLIGIEEIQDNTGPTNNGVVDASETWARLIAAVQAAGGPLYEYRQIDPENNADGGQPGGNIRVGFLFRTDRGLSFIDRPGGDATTPTTVIDHPSGPRLSFSPGRVDPGNPAFVDSRKPLAGEFRFRGKKLFAVVVHFSSKGGDQPLFGRFQPPTRLTETARHGQAQAVADFVSQLRDADPNAYVAMLGDVNDFQFSRTVEILANGGLTTFVDTLPANERYSYVFEGNSQVLDQILGSPPVLARLVEYDVVHVNSEFAVQASDHEPSVARINMIGSR